MDTVDLLRPSRRLLAAALATFVLAAGCATGSAGEDGLAPPVSRDALSRALDDTVVADLAAVLEQTFEPRTTTVQISRRDEDRVTRAIALRLVERGFGVQRVAVDQGPNLLSHARAIRHGGNGMKVTARLSVGPFSVRRDYRIDAAGRVRTGGALRIAGAPMVLPLASLSEESIGIDDPSHLDVEYVASRSRSATSRTEVTR